MHTHTLNTMSCRFTVRECSLCTFSLALGASTQWAAMARGLLTYKQARPARWVTLCAFATVFPAACFVGVVTVNIRANSSLCCSFNLLKYLSWEEWEMKVTVAIHHNTLTIGTVTHVVLQCYHTIWKYVSKPLQYYPQCYWGDLSVSMFLLLSTFSSCDGLSPLNEFWKWSKYSCMSASNHAWIWVFVQWCICVCECARVSAC